MCYYYTYKNFHLWGIADSIPRSNQSCKWDHIIQVGDTMYCIYGLKTDRIRYVGLTKDRERRKTRHRQILTVGTVDFEMIVLFDAIPTINEANEMEKVYIDVHRTYIGDDPTCFNKTRGGGKNTELSDTSRRKMSETHRKLASMGLNPMQSDEQRQRQSKKMSDLNRKRIESGTHHFKSKEFRQKQSERMIGNKLKTNIKAVTEYQRELVSKGMHPWQSKLHKSAQSYRRRMLYKSVKRERYRIFAVLLTARSVMLEYRQRKLEREGFFDKEIADTSNSKQLKLF